MNGETGIQSRQSSKSQKVAINLEYGHNSLFSHKQLRTLFQGKRAFNWKETGIETLSSELQRNGFPHIISGGMQNDSTPLDLWLLSGGGMQSGE